MQQILNFGPFCSREQVSQYIKPFRYLSDHFHLVTSVSLHWQHLDRDTPAFFVQPEQVRQIFSVERPFPSLKTGIRYYDSSHYEGLSARLTELFGARCGFFPDYLQLNLSVLCPEELAQFRAWLREASPQTTLVLEIWEGHLAPSDCHGYGSVTPDELVERLFGYIRRSAIDAIALHTYSQDRYFDSLRLFEYITAIRNSFPQLPIVVEDVGIEDLGQLDYLNQKFPGLSISTIGRLGIVRERYDMKFDFEFMLTEAQTVLNAASSLGFKW